MGYTSPLRFWPSRTLRWSFSSNLASISRRCLRVEFTTWPREIYSSVGLVVAGSLHESSTFRGGGGHNCGRVARLATRQGLLDFSARGGASLRTVPRFRAAGLGFGFWCLVFGVWFLVFGFWFLVFGDLGSGVWGFGFWDFWFGVGG